MAREHANLTTISLIYLVVVNLSTSDNRKSARGGASGAATGSDTAKVVRRRMSAAARRETIIRAATAIFAEQGYDGASMDEIARRIGVSVPVVYDHFASKLALYECLLELHFTELRASWRDALLGAGTLEMRMAAFLDALFAHVESHPEACQMLFRDFTSDTSARALYRQAERNSWSVLFPLLLQEAGRMQQITLDLTSMEMMLWIVRTGLKGLALWWFEHPHVPRRQVIAAGMSILWMGGEQVLQGKSWPIA